MKEKFAIEKRPRFQERWSEDKFIASLITRSLTGIDLSEKSLPRTIQLGSLFDRAREIAADASERSFLYDKDTVERAQKLVEKVEEIIGQDSDLRTDLLKIKYLCACLEVERGSFLIYHPETRKVEWMESIYGEMASVPLPWKEMLAKGAMPLVMLHTHTTDGFFSEEDFPSLTLPFQEFQPFFKGEFEEPIPFCRAALLSAKSDWVLAIRTGLSPLLSLQEWDGLIKEINEERWALLGPLTEQFIKLLKRKDELLGNASRNRLQELKIVDRSISEMLDEDLRIKNGLGLAFARSLELALYHSTDGVNFQRFSA